MTTTNYSVQDYFVRDDNSVRRLVYQSASRKTRIALNEIIDPSSFSFNFFFSSALQGRYQNHGSGTSFRSFLTQNSKFRSYFAGLQGQDNSAVASGIDNFARLGFSLCKKAVEEVNKKYANINGLQGDIDDLQEEILAIKLNMYKTCREIYSALYDKAKYQETNLYSKIEELFDEIDKDKQRCKELVGEFEEKAENYLEHGDFIFGNNNNDEITEDEASVLDLKMSKALIKRTVNKCDLSRNDKCEELNTNLSDAFLLNDQEDNEKNVEKVFGIKDFTTALFCSVDNAFNKCKEDVEEDIERKRRVGDKLSNLEKVSDQLIKTAMDVYEEGRRRVEKFNNINAETRGRVDYEYYLILVNMRKCIEGNLATLEQLENEVDSCDKKQYEKKTIKDKIRRIKDKLLSQQKKCESKGQRFKDYDYDLNQLKLNNQNAVLSLSSCRKTLLNNDYS